jgi:hypothetical protein
MDTDTVRNPENDPTEEYWRRRAIAMGGVVALVALIAWACSAGDEETTDRQPVENAAAVSSPGMSTLPTIMPTVTVTVTAETTVVPKQPGDACEPRDVVLNFTATKDVYAGTDRPRFKLTAVNIGRRACTLGVGPKELEVRITSGPDRIWTSAQCVRGSGSSIQMLRRGVPYVGTIVWDRTRSSSGCTGFSRATARPGTYVATVMTDNIRAKKQVFQLR